MKKALPFAVIRFNQISATSDITSDILKINVRKTNKIANDFDQKKRCKEAYQRKKQKTKREYDSQNDEITINI